MGIHKGGFTLIELLVVIGLLALVASVVLPTYQLILAQFQLSSTTTQVADFVRLTEQKTVTEQKIYGITLTVGATTIPQYSYDPNTATKTALTPLNLPVNLSIGTVSFSGNSDIMFSTSGAPNFSGTFTLKDAVRAKSRTVEVRPSGGIFNNTPEF